MASYGVYATPDPRVAEALGRPVLGPHRMHVHAHGPGFSASLHAAPVGRATVGYLAVGGGTDVVLLAPPRFLVVLPLVGAGGGGEGERPSTATAPRAAVIAPGSPAAIRAAAAAVHLVVGIERQALLAHLGRLLGRPLDRPLAFEPELDVAAPASGRWNLAVDLLHAELFEPRSLLRSGIGACQLDEFLMSSLLYGHRSTYTTALRAPVAGADGLATRTATDFIETHLDQPLSVAAVASAVGLSARTLQLSFRSELQTTPTAYIRDRRLERVRADLAAAPSSGPATVTGIATRWGISHLGRFAAEYRDRFGESPSQTLRA